MPRFPLTSAPLPHESLDSWLEYLATLLNCSVRTVLRQSDIETRVRAGFTLSVDDDFANKLAATTGATPEVIHGATLRRYPNVFAKGIVDRSLASGTTAGYCPLCLSESGWRWHLHWHINTSMVCTIHNVVLLQHCPTCGGRPRLSPTRTVQPIRGSSWKSGPCGPRGCLPSLIAARTAPVDPHGLIVTGQRWIDSLLSADSVELTWRPGLTASPAGLLFDIKSLKRLDIPISGSMNDDRPRDQNIARVLREIDDSSCLEPGRLSHLVTQTLFAAAYTTTNERHAAQFFSFIPSDAGRRLCYHRPFTDNPRRTTTRTTRNLFYRYEFSNVQTGTPSWHRDVLSTLPVAPLPASYLPSRIWPEVVKHHPDVPEAIDGLLPLTTVISLAAMGSSFPAASLRRHFDIVTVSYQIEIELQALWACLNREEILDYYLDLHTALTSQPPAIDYSRRRTLFPSALTIPETPARNPQERRFIWQLLTGSDPFAGTGSGQRFGPGIAAYLRFAKDLPPGHSAQLHSIADTLLHEAGIDDEPLLFTPTYGTMGFESPAHRTVRPTYAEAVLPGTHIIDLAAAEENRTPAEIVRYAISHNQAIARILLDFLATADQPTSISAAVRIGKHGPQQSRAEARIEHLLGRAIYTRARAGNPRSITRAGRALRDLCESHRFDLERAAQSP